MKIKLLFIALATTVVFGLGLSAHAVGPAYNGGGNYGYVCTHQQNSNVLLRLGPGQNYKVLAYMPNGSDVRIIGERNSNGWVWYDIIKTSDVPCAWLVL